MLSGAFDDPVTSSGCQSSRLPQSRYYLHILSRALPTSTVPAREAIADFTIEEPIQLFRSRSATPVALKWINAPVDQVQAGVPTKRISHIAASMNVPEFCGTLSQGAFAGTSE